MRILIIDDDGLAAAITAALLEEIGYDTLIAESVSEARTCLAAEPDIGIIICDLQMPDTDGLAFFRQLRHEGSQLPFVLLTGTKPLPADDGEMAPEMCLLKDENLDLHLGKLIAQILARDTL